MGLATRLAYRATATARTAFFGAHYLMARRLAGPAVVPGRAPPPSRHPPPDLARLRAAFLDAFEQDLAHVEAGLYLSPAGPRLKGLAARSRDYLDDVRAIDARRLADQPVEVRDREESAGYPAYFRQNFHWQSDGWFSAESAARYEFQVEAIFTGAAAPMRRATALALLAGELAGRDQRSLSVLDLACGAGGFALEIARNHPRLQLTAADMSPAYAAEAARTLRARPRARALVANAEALPLADASQDAVTCIYLFHELPPKARVAVVREVARVLKPGGAFILADSLQTGDDPNLDRMLDAFPALFHEPFYASWLDTDIDGLCAGAGLVAQERRRAFLTKGVLFRKPGTDAG